MTNQIAIIDPFVKSPAVHCFNRLVNLLGLKATYHMPGSTGLETMLKESPNTQAYIVLGSASHVHENLPWHRPMSDFLLKELLQNKPVLGCCFGHQIICHTFGAKVEFYLPDEGKQMGTRKVTINQDFWNFKKGESFTMGVTHRQVVRDLPSDLIEVGSGLENDIVIHRKLPFMGTQAHPEASDYFCRTDIEGLSSDEIAALQEGGGQLIKRFFQHFKLI